MPGNVRLHRVLRAPAERDYRAFTYLGWQESMLALARLVEPEIKQ